MNIKIVAFTVSEKSTNTGYNVSCHTQNCLIAKFTDNHLILAASEFGNFRRLIYWRILILEVLTFNAHENYFLIS